MRRPIAALADTLVLALAVGVLVVIITGGGIFFIGDQRVSMMGVDNPLLALTLVGALRYVTLPGVPLFGLERWPMTSVEQAARSMLVRGVHRIETTTPAAATRIVAAAVALSIALKLLLAWTYPGFFSGDDVEIHEMSIGALWNARWPIWDLRNAFFPLGVVYPVQKLFVAARLDDASSLVFAGRLSVAVLSSLAIVLVWRAGMRLMPSAPGWAVVAAVLFATTQLHIAFGSSELPRPVATVFVLGAFLLLLQDGAGRVAAASVMLGAAAALRFSEAVFLAPAVLTLGWQRRWAASVLLVCGAAVSALAIVGLTDAWYWGEPFHSLKAVVDYTFVQRLSSRGYQNVLWYALHLFVWLSPALALFAVLALVTSPRLTDAWWWLPVLVLSLLPHKEARYMIPIVPFACLTAVRGLRVVVDRIRADTRQHAWNWRPLALIALLCIGLAYDAGHWRLPRSNADVTFAQRAHATLQASARIGAEQAWRLGGRLYLHPREVFDLDPNRLADPEYLRLAVPPDAAVMLDGRDVVRYGLVATLQSRGYRKEALAVEGSRYELWLPSSTR
jgi:hypothetical protein